MSSKPFDASKYLTDLNGKDYLEVKWRLLWLRTEHPDAIVDTELVKHGAGVLPLLSVPLFPPDIHPGNP
ncbi:MAG: hypothetical protein U1B78_04065, partial [Dehalococcoidia bacterium]|nr:hypothetical protein [Dehalococcoidia bacterium]